MAEQRSGSIDLEALAYELLVLGGRDFRPQAARADSPEDRLARLDARIRQAPGQGDLFSSPKAGGGGQACGASHIAPGLTCHKGQARGRATPLKVEVVTSERGPTMNMVVIKLNLDQPVAWGGKQVTELYAQVLSIKGGLAEDAEKLLRDRGLVAPGQAPTAHSILFEVSDTPSMAGEGLDRQPMDPAIARRLALGIKSQIEEVISTIPDGDFIAAVPWEGDDLGERRRSSYARAGFTFPSRRSYEGVAVVKNGKLARIPDATLEGRVDRLEQRLDRKAAEMLAQAYTPGGVQEKTLLPGEQHRAGLRAKAKEEGVGRRGQPCGASHISPSFECHKGQGPASSADEQIEALTDHTLSVLQKFPEYMPSAEQRHGITDTELAVLQHYAENGYTEMNGFLRGEKPADPELARKLNNHMKAALAKLPEFKGPVSRGVAIPKAVLEQQFKVGQVGWDPGYGSTTKQPEEEAGILGQEWSPNFFAMENARGRLGMEKVLLRYAPGHGGKDITHLSGNPAEQEVLIPPGQKFRVTARQEEQRLVWGAVGRRPETFTVIDLEPVRRPRRDAFEVRLVRLDARIRTPPLSCSLTTQVPPVAA